MQRSSIERWCGDEPRVAVGAGAAGGDAARDTRRFAGRPDVFGLGAGLDLKRSRSVIVRIRHIETPFSRTSNRAPVTNFSEIVRLLYDQPESDRFERTLLRAYSPRSGSIGLVNNYPT